MRLTDLFDKERAFRFLLGFVFSLLFLAVVSIPASSLAGFYDNLDGLSESVQREDFSRAEAELSDVTGFYESSRSWGLQWFADAYLFSDAFLQQASYNYLTGNFEAVVRDLADEIDDPRASHLLGSAKFQLARLRYRAIPDEDENGEAHKLAIIQEVLEDVNADFERSLRSDRSGRFDYKWNYDLTSDPEAVRRALEPLREVEPPQLEQMRGEGTPVRRRRG
jgi:hypothetical protein